jgi:hypothetical protein
MEYFDITIMLLISSIVQINTESVQDMHIYMDPSRVPVLLIEQHVMVVPQHGSSKDLASDASEFSGKLHLSDLNLTADKIITI